MQKDVIYIDVEDDITSIIGKIKESKRHIVALVPPKRIGAIQSAVNLKLVHRAAEQIDKRLVIISNNAALVALAGSAGIPVAKNLQSKPELAEIPALDIDDGNDIIDGSAVTVDPVAKKLVAKSLDSDAPSHTQSQSGTAKARLASLGATAVAAKDKASIPNFDRFRKKLFLGLGVLVAGVGFLVWALMFAPHANIIITARTTDSALNSAVSFGPGLSTSLKEGTIKAVQKNIKKDVELPITATGQKDVGTKAVGQVKFSTSQISALGTVIPAGTELETASGATYVTDASMTITLSNYGGAFVTITAIENGTKYNGATGAMSGAPSGISTVVSQTTSGGTDKTVTVVQQSDVDKAAVDTLKRADMDAARDELKKQFGGDYIVLDATFKSDTTAVKPSPAVDAEAPDGKGTLSGSIVISLVAIEKNEARRFLDDYFLQQVDGKNDQKIYSNGLGAISFTNISGKDSAFTANISTNGKIGPRIDEMALRDFAKGKNFGEIQEHVEEVGGVDNVDVKFSPFWVSAAPNDTARITVEFKVDGA